MAAISKPTSKQRASRDITFENIHMCAFETLRVFFKDEEHDLLMWTGTVSVKKYFLLQSTHLHQEPWTAASAEELLCASSSSTPHCL